MTDPTIWAGSTTSVPVINVNGNIFEETQVATAAQTVFTLLTFTYTPSTHSIFIWKNGLMLRRGVDYTETSSSIITLALGATLGDKLTFVAYAIQQIIPPIVFNGMPAGGTAGQILTKTSSSDYEANWASATSITTLLDAARVNIASASTVNLAAIAATTRNIQITGAVQIDGFQITNGQVWAAKFASALTLKNNANIVTQSGYDIKISPNDTCFIRATADNVVEIVGYSKASQPLAKIVNNFRLTPVSGTPVSVADTLAAATIYCSPYIGNEISLFDGTSWVTRVSAEFSIALAGLVAGRPYDVYCYDNAGVPTLEILAWTSSSVRATFLTTQDGIIVKNGDPTRRYIGSFHTVTANTTEDSYRRRLIWNYYNRVDRPMLRIETVATWVYTTATVRQANGSTLNQLECVIGVQEDAVRIDLLASYSNTGAATAGAGIGLDSTTNISGSTLSNSVSTAAAALVTHIYSSFQDSVAPGFHYFSWVESSQALGTTTWQGIGTNASTTLGYNCGLSGKIRG